MTTQPSRENAAHVLAHEIEWVSARREASARNRPGRGPRYTAHDCYDMLAAIELAELILRRMS